MRRTLLAVAIAVASTWGSAPPAAASCAPPPSMATAIEDAAAVFVGTVRDVTNSDRWALVEVSEVWKGEVEGRVEVQAGPKDPPGPMGAASSVDRTFDEGKTYLFLPHAGNRIEFKDSICSRTTVYREGLERFRPAGAFRVDREPPAADDDGSRAWWWIIAAAAAAAVLAGGLAARRRAAS